MTNPRRPKRSPEERKARRAAQQVAFNLFFGLEDDPSNEVNEAAERILAKLQSPPEWAVVSMSDVSALSDDEPLEKKVSSSLLEAKNVVGRLIEESQKMLELVFSPLLTASATQGESKSSGCTLSLKSQLSLEGKEREFEMLITQLDDDMVLEHRLLNTGEVSAEDSISLEGKLVFIRKADHKVVLECPLSVSLRKGTKEFEIEPLPSLPMEANQLQDLTVKFEPSLQ